MKKLLGEFKSFAMKGNVIDLAVGVIMGGAFGKIVASLVNDIIMPMFSKITGNFDIVNARYVVVEKTATAPEVAIRYGSFLQTVIDFLIIAFSIFMVIKVFNRFKKKQEIEEAPKAEPLPSAEQILLTEIRDILKNK